MTKLEQAITYLQHYNDIKELYSIYDFNTFRALMNRTLPKDLDEEYYRLQDAILEEEKNKKQLTDVDALEPIVDGICLWQGDITTLIADGIVNAANAAMLGCFTPLHACIDNAIHSFAGLQLRRDLMELMEKQAHREPVGSCKLTKAYNLPSQYVLHTVGPMIVGFPDKIDAAALKNCYMSCLDKALEFHLKNLVFCSISTGVYGYPIQEACQIAVSTVNEYLSTKPHPDLKRVVFNVFSKRDYECYLKCLKQLKN